MLFPPASQGNAREGAGKLPPPSGTPHPPSPRPGDRAPPAAHAPAAHAQAAQAPRTQSSSSSQSPIPRDDERAAEEIPSTPTAPTIASVSIHKGSATAAVGAAAAARDIGNVSRLPTSHSYSSISSSSSFASASSTPTSNTHRQEQPPSPAHPHAGRGSSSSSSSSGPAVSYQTQQHPAGSGSRPSSSSVPAASAAVKLQSASWVHEPGVTALAASSSRPLSMATSSSSANMPGGSGSSRMSTVPGASTSSADETGSSSHSLNSGHVKRSSTPRTASPPPTRTSSLGAGTSAARASHVQAVHDFDPSIMPTSALKHNMYLTFHGGEIIRVHGRDPSGWWDGEVEGTNGHTRRGWFPSNYVREVDWHELYGKGPGPVFENRPGDPRSRHASMVSHPSRASHFSHHSHNSSQHSSTSQIPTRSTSSHGSMSSNDPNTPFGPPPNLSPGLHALFQPIVQSLTLLQTSIRDSNLGHIQPSTAAVISAIRIALVRMDCMGRDSAVLSANPILSKDRRYVLAELSKLVACAKLTADSDLDGDPSTALESTGRAARSVFNLVRRFMLHASDAGVTVLSLGHPSEIDTPRGSTELGSRGRSPSVSGGTRTTPQPETGRRLKSASVSDLRGASRRQTSGAPPMPNSASSTGSTARPGSRSGHIVMSPATGTSSGSGRSSPVSLASRRRGSSHHLRSTSLEQYGLLLTDSPDIDVASDLSHGSRRRTESSFDHEALKEFATGYAVHEAIAVAEDALLSIIASFIGHIHSHHIDSHPSSHAYLIELTRETVDRVRDLLTIVEAVGRQAGTLGVHNAEVENLRSSRAQLYHATTRLVEGAEAVANAPFSEGGEEAYDAEKAELLQVTTTTLRAGTECARVVRKCVPGDLGDSDYDSPSLSAGRQSVPNDSDTSDYDSPNLPNGLVSPRFSRYSGVGLGIRSGQHTLSSTLSRRATSLGQLHRRYHQDAGVHAGSAGHSRSPRMVRYDDDEEIVADLDDEGRDERKAGRGSARPTSHPGGALTADTDADDRRRSSETAVRGSRSRSRATSLTGIAKPGLRSKSPAPPARRDSYSKEQSETPSTTSRPSTLSSQGRGSAQFTPSETQATPGLSDAPLEFTDVDGGKSIELQSPLSRSPVGGAPPSRPPVVGASPLPPGEEGGEMRFWVVAHDYDPHEVAFNSDGVLVGGTLCVLVEKMTPHDGMPDTNSQAAFWYTFRLFCKPLELVEALIARYQLKPPPVVEGMDQKQLEQWKERKLMPVRLRVYNFFKSWLDQHWRPESDDVILEAVEAFARDIVATSLPAGMSDRLIEQVRKRQVPLVTLSESNNSGSVASSKSSSFERMRNSTLSGMLHSPATPSQVPTPVISKALHAQLLRNPAVTVISILDFDTLELARQLTIMESHLFAAVAPEDLLMTGKKSVPELKALSTLSNQITGWVADGILNEQDAKHRGALLKFYIKLADKCLSLNNYSTLFAVLAGLNSSTIMRLKKTWDVLSPKYRVLMERLRGVIEHTKNHQAYRTRLRETVGPCLPFLGLILSDITFTQDGNPNKRPSTLSPELQLINMDKYTKLGRIAADFRRYQMPFDLKELEPVQQYLQRVLAERGSGSLDALYRKSLLLEPRKGSERLSSAVEKPGWLGVKLQV